MGNQGLTRRRVGQLGFLVFAPWFTLMSLLAGSAPAIYNGYNASIHTFPWMVSLRFATSPNSHLCNGTLIQPDIVLTAGHCVDPSAKGQHGLVAVVGADTPQWPSAPRIRVVGVRRPSTWGSGGTNRDDIAVVRLAVRLTVPTIRLATSEPRPGTRAATVGWGCTDKPPACTTYPKHLQGAHQVVIADSACGHSVFFHPPSYAPTSVCAKGSGSTSIPNSGDSGGPLFVRPTPGQYVEFGLTSLGSDDHTKLYEEYTSIPAELAWITAAIKSLHS